MEIRQKEDVSVFLNEALEEFGIKPQELSEISGVSYSQMCNILRGNSEVRVGTLISLLQSLGYKLTVVSDNTFKNNI